MKELQAVGLSDADKDAIKREPVRSVDFSCTCGCFVFRVEWAVFGDHSGETRIKCAQCDQLVLPREPVFNGPH